MSRVIALLHGCASVLWLRCMVLALLLPSTAQGLTQIDSSRSHALFEMPLLLVGSVKGRFQQIGGHVHESDGTVRVCAAVTVTSALMRRAKDREELLGPSFFDAAAFPQLSFVSAPMRRSALSPGALLDGELTVRGIRQPAAFTLAQLQCPDSDTSAGCQLVLQGVIRRGDFGMRARRGVLGNNVTLQLVIQLCAAGADCGAAVPVPVACAQD